jgi:hypothetical protein
LESTTPTGHAEFHGLLNGDVLLVGVDHHQHIRQAAHLLDAAERAVEFVAFTRQVQQFLFGQAADLFLSKLVLEYLQALDRVGYCFPVRHHAAEPAVIDIVLAAAFGGLGDQVARLTFGADEQHASAGGDDVANRDQRLMQHRNRLFQIDNMDAVADPEEVGSHLRIPAAGGVAEMNASFEQLTHGEVR